MTTPHFSNDVPLLERQVSPTVAMVSQEDTTLLAGAWLQSSELFREARRVLQHHVFTPNEIVIGLIWSALCIADDGYEAVTRDMLISLIEEQLHNQVVPFSPATVERITRRGEGGFVHDALAQPLAASDLARAREIQRHLLVERTILAPLRQYCNPGTIPLGFRPENITEFLNEIQQQQKRIESATAHQIQTVADCWDEHEARLEQFRGRRSVGLETGFTQLDQKTLGLRGVTVLGARPSVGKTGLCLQLATQVCKNWQANDAIVVFLSLELSRDDLVTRIKCHATQIDWRSYVRGNPSDSGPRFDEGQEDRRNRASQEIRDGEVGNRLTILERMDLGTDHSTAAIVALVNRMKERVGANRALIVIDYLQLIEIPADVARKGDLESDKYRVRVVQDIVAETRTEQNPLGDAVLVISEARKPSGDGRQNRVWGNSLADLMGSARLGYAADAVLLYRRMTEEDVREHYNDPTAELARSRIERLEQRGIAPVVLTLAKGRDGMSLGDIPMEFHFWRSTFFELLNGLCVQNESSDFPRQRNGRRVLQETQQ